MNAPTVQEQQGGMLINPQQNTAIVPYNMNTQIVPTQQEQTVQNNNVVPMLSGKVEQKPDGNFYVTNYPLRNDKFSRIINNGQIIYDLSDQPAIQNIVSENNIITNEKTTFNPTETQTNEKIRQVAPKTAKKQGLVDKKPKVKNKNSIMTYKNDSDPINENENFYTDFNYIVKKDYFKLIGQGKTRKAVPEFNNEINKLYKEFDENFTFNKATVTDNVTYKNATKPIAVTLEYTNNKGEQKKTFLTSDYKKQFKGYSFDVSNEVHNGHPIIKVIDNGETVGYVTSFVPDENKIKIDHIDQTDDMVKTAEKVEKTNKISSKTSQKAREVLNALQKIVNGSEEETVKNLRDDLEQYGGTNDVTFIYGNHKKGIQHIAEKHGSKTLLKVFDTVVDGKIKRFVAAKKTVIIGKGNYEAVLSLDENGNKKSWLLSGWEITNENKKSSDVNGEVSTQSATTQIKPIFSRQDLGAELNNIISNSDIDLNPNVKNSEQTRETDKGVELYMFDKKNKIYKFKQEILDNSDNVSKFWNYKKTKFNDLIYMLSLEDVIEEIDNFAEIYSKKISLSSNIKSILKEKAKKLNISGFNSKNSYGVYGENTIKINKSKTDKLPVFVMALSHEYWHNVQGEIKQEILKIPKNERTNEQNKFLEKIEISKEFYKEKSGYLKKYPKVKKIIIKLSELNNIQERQKYVEKLNRIDYIRYKYFVQEILPQYDILETEKEAFEIGNYFAKGYDNGRKNVKVSGRNRKPNIPSDKIRRYINGLKRRRGRNTSEEELSDYSSYIPDDIDEILPKVKPPKDNTVEKIITPISTRLDEINPTLKHAIRKFEFESGITENKYANIISPFIRKLDYMTPSDYAKYDLALKNGNKEVITALNDKYKLSEDYANVRNLLDNIRDEALNVGMNVGYIEDYFPRKTINSSAILEEYSKSSYIRKLLKEIDPNNTLSDDEKLEKINIALKGHNGAINANSSFVKARKITEITKDLNRYYNNIGVFLVLR